MDRTPLSRASPERLIESAEEGVAELARSELFFREFALHLARKATADFGRGGAPATDGATAVQAFVRHETQQGRLRPGEITSVGSGHHVHASVHACPFQQACQSNLRELSEVPQCVRAITLIQAIGTRVPDRPPMTYDVRPGLVDGQSSACELHLRPVLEAPVPPTLR